MLCPLIRFSDDEDYWYYNRHLLESGQVFSCYDNSIVKLDRRVPGDGTKWYVAIKTKQGFIYDDYEIEPGELYRQELEE